MRPDKAPLRPVHVNWFLNDGGLGDQVARLPAARHAIIEHYYLFLHVFVPNYFVDFARHLLRDYERVFVKSFSDTKRKGTLLPNTPAMSSLSQEQTTLRRHLTDHAFHVLGDTSMVEPRDRAYLKVRTNEIDVSNFNLPSRFVVLTTGFTAAVREWPAKEINHVASWLVSQGIVPVFLGKKETEVNSVTTIKGNFDDGVDYSVGVDLRDQTTLLEAAAIMASSLAVCGVDNGLLHVAGCTEVPIVAGFTTVDPAIRVPIRERGETRLVVPPESLACRFCQNKMHYIFQHDFRTCYYGDRACVETMKATNFINHLKELLNV